MISETLRMATILPWFSRKASQDFEIDGMASLLDTKIIAVCNSSHNNLNFCVEIILNKYKANKFIDWDIYII